MGPCLHRDLAHHLQAALPPTNGLGVSKLSSLFLDVKKRVPRVCRCSKWLGLSQEHCGWYVNVERLFLIAGAKLRTPSECSGGGFAALLRIAGAKLRALSECSEIGCVVVFSS